MRKHWKILIPLLFATVAAQAAADERGIEYFRVVPGNCIVKSEDLCEVRFQFYWGLHQPEEVCIYHRQSESAAYCSPVRRTGKTALMLAVEETTEFTLKLKLAPQHIATESVQVLAIGRDVRLRRRHLWSIL